MTILRDLSVLWSLSHILILFILLYRSRYSQKRTIILTAAFMGPLVLLHVVGLVIYGAEFMGQAFLLTATLPSLLFFWFMSQDKKGQFFFTFCLADTVSFWIIVLTQIVDFYFGGQRYILMLIGRLVLFPLVEWVAYRYLRKPYRELQESVTKGWGLFAGMTALYYLLLAVMTFFPVSITKRPQELPAFLLIMALMPMTYATILVSMYHQLLLFRRQQSERMLREQKNTLEMRLENQQCIRKMKHDMKSYTATLSGLLAAGKTDEAKNYLRDMEQEMDSGWGQFCQNPYINATVAYYDRKLEELHAKRRIDIRAGEEALPHIELCRILANGIENACDELSVLAQDEREMSVRMQYNRDCLLIRIKNRCREGRYVEQGKLPETDKEGRGHGYGLCSMQDAVERLSGDMVCYTENGYFVLDVMIPCRSFMPSHRESSAFRTDDF